MAAPVDRVEVSAAARRAGVMVVVCRKIIIIAVVHYAKLPLWVAIGFLSPPTAEFSPDSSRSPPRGGRRIDDSRCNRRNA
jgi:hypothetical protein